MLNEGGLDLFGLAAQRARARGRPTEEDAMVID